MRFVALLARAGLTFLLTLALIDVAVRAFFPPLPRLATNFSAAYLDRTIARITPRDDVVLGDSVLWGYRLPASASAVALLAKRGVPLVNLSFEGGSMANTYALLKLMELRRIRPHAVVFNVNVKEFNAADSAYRTLYPGVERAVWDALSPAQRGRLKPTQTAASFDGRADARLSGIWALYGMRSDVRELLFGQADAVTAVKAVVNELSGESARADAAHAPTPDRFLGTYDLAPLVDSNVEVAFLHDTVAQLDAMHLPALAILTPANHTLLHDYIDVPEYDAQLRYIGDILRRGGVRVANYDRAFPSSDFIDNDHLTAAGNAKLAQMLSRDLPP